MLKSSVRLINVLLALVFALPALASPTNPLIFADFSDPDVVRHGDTFYMVSSSFQYMPGVPVLASKDMVNWRRVGHVMGSHPQYERFSKPQHGNGMWAPCIRYHDGRFWVFMPDPDHGIYVSSAEDPAGQWSEPHLLLPGAGIIDPTPLWDDDGNAYLLHAWAKSRAGFNNLLTLHRMSADAREILDEGTVVIDGNLLPGFRTLEGPKFYKRGRYYYVFAPAGGVEEGWQTVFRSRNIYGPYETRVTLEQGTTAVNGPHQGAWVDDSQGRDWFFHFQDRGPFGRIVHLQPMRWEKDWPLMGRDLDGNGVGEPLAELPLPTVEQQPLAGLSFSDEFDQQQLGLQWQWNGNWQSNWFSLSANAGFLRLFAQPMKDNLWQQAAIISQMFIGPAFNVETRLSLAPDSRKVQSGLLLYGYDYAWLGIRATDSATELVYTTCEDTMNGCRPDSQVITTLEKPAVELKVSVDESARARYHYRASGERDWRAVEVPRFSARQGRWVGARVGLFAESGPGDESVGNAVDVDYFRMSLAD